MNKSKIFSSILDNGKFINIKNISMNSKTAKNGDLFVAIRGGNKFLNEALEKGAYVIYDDENAEIDEVYLDRVFFVEDSIEFLQRFARKWRNSLGIKVIGITGSNGKTTVKDMIYHILSIKFKGKKTEGNYNNHIGLPFTLLRSELEDEFMILEMGMSGFNEIDLLGEISEPDISVITNIGESHLEYLKTKENVFKAKTEILPHTGSVLVINGDDFYLKGIEDSRLKIIKVLKDKTLEILDKEANEIIENRESYKGKSDKEVSNIRENNNFYYGDISFNEEGTEFTLKYFGKKCRNNIERRYKTNVIGEHNILNLCIAIAVVKEMGIEDSYIEEAVKNISLTDMRFQIIPKGNTTYINDAYNASPMSMEKSLDTFSGIYNDRLKIAVLGDMLELGEKEAKLHASLSDVIGRIKIDKLYLYGPRMSSLYERVKENSKKENIENDNIENTDFGKIETEYFSSKEDIRKRLSQISEKKAVLLKASRGMKLEEVMD